MGGARHKLQFRIVKIPLGGSERIDRYEVFHVPGGWFVLSFRDDDGTPLRSNPEGASDIAQLMINIDRERAEEALAAEESREPCFPRRPRVVDTTPHAPRMAL